MLLKEQVNKEAIDPQESHCPAPLFPPIISAFGLVFLLGEVLPVSEWCLGCVE